MGISKARGFDFEPIPYVLHDTRRDTATFKIRLLILIACNQEWKMSSEKSYVWVESECVSRTPAEPLRPAHG